MAPVYPLGVNVVLACVGGAVYAVSGTGAHMACPLFMGRLEGYTIVCPCHDWRFDARTGRFLNSLTQTAVSLPCFLPAGSAAQLGTSLDIVRHPARIIAGLGVGEPAAERP